MQRIVTADYREAIAEAFAIIPERIAERLQHVQFFTGTDPVWAGLHPYRDTGDGRSYSDTAHCAYTFHTLDHRTTIVLPTPQAADPFVVVHELGHALDEVLGFDHAAVPVTEYARVNRQEAFAEALRAHLYWYGDQSALWRDEATRSLFDRLAA